MVKIHFKLLLSKMKKICSTTFHTPSTKTVNKYSSLSISHVTKFMRVISQRENRA